ncbi:hypothetical protein NC797_00060 [Aquibacillus sp. 3ASR75-11]|uniref:Uncharacterized protein n=1 Tax=Terrihalobacillus insolitus TaxID=2950438 RepID=A0A9X3WN99_9BACI|nr:hypothetical protein [Terrihalobacillus insolitus]MDC3412410.1 hypothetical protein [Terrihalobacillus insolitus]MDC3422897.1 hypothetical protein [Terrihalobacillus insolitus]
MKFADHLLQLYIRHFNDKDSLEVFIHSVLEQMDHEELMKVLNKCNKEELEEILGSYLRNNLEHKFNYLGIHVNNDNQLSNNIQ